MANNGNNAFSLSAVTPTIPPFTFKELHERLNGVLGRDATGVVYSLEGYPSLAVKEILLEGLDRSSVDAIKLELTALFTLFHPGVIKYHQVVEDESFFYVVTDRHDKTLERLLTEHKRRKIPVSAGVILSVMKQLTAALAYLHSVNGANTRGLVHRDLRPANVFISADGERFVIADFGLCRDALWSGSTLIGIMAYVAPEVLLHNEASPASDVWSLGVIIYELVTLRRPDFLGGKEPAEVFIDGWRPDLSGVTDGFIKSILERIFVLEPERRPTARELHETLATFDIPVSELGGQCVMLRYKCGSLEAALNGANARIALLEEDVKIKSTKIDALEDQSKEHLAMIKALENRLAQFSDRMNTADPQSSLFLLPRLMRAAHTNSTETVWMLLEERLGVGQRDAQGMTALMHAAQQGHVDPVELLVGEENGLQDKNGWTALMHASYNNHPEVTRILILHECRETNKNNQTALMIAAEKGHAEVASLLASHEKGLADNEGKTALMVAAQKGNLEMIKILLGHEKGIKDKQNHNALYYALKNGHPELVEILVEHDDPTDKDDITALMRAAARGDTEMVKLLIPIQKGIKDSSGNTAFVHALNNDRTDTAMILREYEASSWTQLMCASFIGDIETVRNQLSDKEKKNDDGDTALTLAAQAGYEDVVEILSPTDGRGTTALMRAADTNDVEVLKTLISLQKGRKAEYVKIDKWEIYEGTALMRAAIHGYTEAVRQLVAHESGMKDSDGQTALILAAYNGHLECIRLLLSEEGGMQDNKGRTALMGAVRNNHPECVKLLLGREAGMHDKYGWTALIWAIDNNNIECVRLLAEKEGDVRRTQYNTEPHLTCACTETPLDMARKKGYEEIVAILTK
ncbi:Ankyrin repeat protein [Giardia duodenalis]|uniref:Ankyrin repeat protein n=1 Tax=Giardia intestinalis TaxID=5741 RepID=V6TD93_GIAIN|nr:Ankyrin repeat protein [Giardia intestinalis]